MGRRLNKFIDLVVLLLTLLPMRALAQYGTPAPAAKPDNTLPKGLENVGIDQKLDTQVPLDLTFADEEGKIVRLRDLLHKDRPVVFSLVYYKCPMLCTVVLNDMLRGFVSVPLLIGKDYDVITVSFDPNETPQLAAEKKQHYVRTYSGGGRAERGGDAQAGWHFLTGNAQNIEALTRAVGFRYIRDEKSQQFFHPSGIVILTPDGKIARYFFGIDYKPKDLRLSLVEASQGKVGTVAEQVMLYCYHYDATTGKYGVAIMNLVRAGGVLTVAALTAGIVMMLRRERAAKA
jgi:protein SCO1/2